jgi:hypothetical protein
MKLIQIKRQKYSPYFQRAFLFSSDISDSISI